MSKKNVIFARAKIPFYDGKVAFYYYVQGFLLNNLMWWRSVWFLCATFGTFFFVLPNLLWIIVWRIGKIFSFKVAYAPWGWTALGLATLIVCIFCYGHYVGRFCIEVNEVEYASKDVPEAFDGLRILQISDLHVDSYIGTPEKLQALVDRINEQKADVILFTGDMTTSNIRDVWQFEPILKQIKAPMGVKSVLGNHDFFIYEYRDNDKRIAASDTLTRFEEDKLGWQVLRNQSCLLERGEQRIAIAGVDNINGNQGFKTIQKGDLRKAMEGLEGVFTVLMTHDPSHWTAEVLPKSHAQITLSGHTHAGQFRLFGWSFAHFSFKECDGRYDRDGRMLYVNAGSGCTAPFRVSCPSEITVITLRNR